MTVSEQKKNLRAVVRKMERELDPEYKKSADLSITNRIFCLPEYKKARSVFCFVGTEREIDTTALLEDALARGKKLLVPLCTGPGVMELRQITALSQLEAGTYGILEPRPDTPEVDKSEVDFAVVPCVSCDRQGHRLGQGGGYYDRFFVDCAVPAVLVCREALIQEVIPVEKHDIVFEKTITELAVYTSGFPVEIAE